jgi:GntR family transcriptional regulator
MPPVPPARPAPAQAASRTDALAQALAATILDGSRPVGAELPSETEIAATHKVGVAAARAAVRQLEALGLVSRSRGGAARVVSSEIRATYTVASAGTQIESSYIGGTRVVVDRQRQVAADAELAVLLGVAEGTLWLHLTGLRGPPDATFGPLSWIDIWLASDAGNVPDDTSFVLEEIEKLVGVSIAAVQEDISAGMLTPAQARLLRARGGTAALHVLRRYLRSGGTVVAAIRDVHPAERITVCVRGPKRP